MCGIAGILDLRGGAPIELAELERMATSMAHRGPDAAGARVYEGGVGLAHRRLSILDLRPESNQPFESEDGQVSITFNGEIFNYVELRDELIALGRRFRTTSDTEVLVQAYQQWGDACVPRLNGMWAFAIYDHPKRRLFCSRDRFGIKPFVYASVGGRMLFASEAKAILAVARQLARPNYDSISMILRGSYGARHFETCFDGIHRLQSAHNLIVEGGKLRTERYWDYPVDSNPSITAQDAAEGLREQLIDSLRLRMRSDVPVGATLSGGLDSSSLVCLLRTFYHDPMETFTAANPGDSFDEAPIAERLSNSLGMHSNLFAALPEDLLDTLRKIVRHIEAPIPSPAVIPLWSIMKAAKSKITVIFEGQGADEVLAGYYACMQPLVFDHLRHARVDKAWSEFRWEVDRSGWRRAALLAGRTQLPSWFHRMFRTARGDELVYAGPLKHAADYPAGGRGEPPMSDALNKWLRDRTEGGLVDLLHYGDAISMAHSMESRLPFLDHRLVEYSFRLPGAIKYRQGHGKAVLRDAVRDVVPTEIVDNRKKLGFVTPISRWFRDEPETTVYPILRSEKCRARGLFDPANLERALERHRTRKADLSSNIFRWLLTELWFEEFIDSN